MRAKNPKTHGSLGRKPRDPRGGFSGIVADASPALRPVCRALRRQIASVHPGFTELVWPSLGIASYGVGPRKMTEHYAYIGVQKDHVNLGFYRGAALADPAGLLEGSGKNLRHVKIRDGATARGAAVLGLLQASLAPFLAKA